MFLIMIVMQSFLLWLDHHPMFFFGDSASYIWTAVSGWLPSDRSFVYGYFIRLVSVTTRSLQTLVIVQTLLAVSISLVSAHLLIRYFAMHHWIAFGTACVMTLEPLQLLYTRYVMTETLALFLFVFYVWVALQYLDDIRIKWLLLMQFLATVMICIRFAFIPFSWISAFAIPVIAVATAQQTRMTFKVKVLHVCLSVFFIFAFTTIYKHMNGYLHHESPAYSYDDGFFALGYVIPIVQASDFPDQALGEQVLRNARFPLADRRARGAHRWMEGGVVWYLKIIERNHIKANQIAYKTALHAVISKPFAFLHLGWQSFTDHFDSSYFRMYMETELGNRRLDDSFLHLIKAKFRYPADASSAMDLKSLTGRYFLLSQYWLQGLLFVPLLWIILTVFARDADLRRKNIMFTVWALIVFAEAIFFIERPVPRYFHIMAWFACMATGIGVSQFLAKDFMALCRNSVGK